MALKRPISILYISFICMLYSDIIISHTLSPSISKVRWGIVDGKEVWLYTLKNKNGMTLKVTNYGATLVDLITPDKNGKMESIVLGFDSLKGYMSHHPNFGSTIGRYANRITGARINIDGTSYLLKANRNGTIIHGGKNGFSHQVFTVDSVFNDNTIGVRLKYLSRDGEEGFPGNLNFSLSYLLTPNNELILEYEAETDKTTIVNFTNHSYFNLSGCHENVLEDKLLVMADSILDTSDEGSITGTLSAVKDTPYDFSTEKEIDDGMLNLNQKVYDVCYQLKSNKDKVKLAAKLFNMVSGRTLEAYTTEPGMQLFVSDRDLKEFEGHNHITYKMYDGVCLEMQHYPDAPLFKQFPSVVLRPGEIYHQKTIYKFGLHRGQTHKIISNENNYKN